MIGYHLPLPSLFKELDAGVQNTLMSSLEVTEVMECKTIVL